MDNFSKDWWFYFLEKNFSFSETAVYKNIISEKLQKELLDGVREMLSSRINRLDISDGFRLYIQGKELSDSDILNKIRGNSLNEAEDIQSYCNRIFGNNYGIIANYCEKHSDILSKNILKTIKPLFDIIGVPAWGIELTTFIGNYGWTPLGIHTDNRGENVLHYHLGPGSKTMYVWDEDVYKEKCGNISNNQNIKPLLKYSKKYNFSSGDMYYMPWNKNHIGCSEEFSIGVTLWFNNPTRYSFTRLMIETIKNLFVKNDQSIIESQIDYLTNPNTFSDFIKTLNIDETTLKGSLIDFLRENYDDYKKCLMSNGGWQNIPLNLHSKIDDSSENLRKLKNKTLSINNLFNIYTERKNDRLIVYTRGNKLSFKYFPELISILNEIKTHKNGIPVSEIIHGNNGLSEDVILYFLKILINNRGIEVKKT